MRGRFRKRKERKDGKNQHRRYAYFVSDMLCGMLLLAFLFFPAREGFELDMLDVGQGDAEFIRTEEGYTVFIDGGSSDVGRVGEYRILPFLKAKGVRSIDYWFVSHADNDHISGLLEVLMCGYPVRHMVFYQDILQDDAFMELLALAKASGSDIIYMKKGNILHLGEASFAALSPEYASGDRNKDSLVLWFEEDGFSALFTGDIGKDEERKLLTDRRFGQAEFYKAAHHGSNGSNSSEFLEKLKPKVTGISCAKKNRYGHPGDEAVCHMEESGSSVFYTMEAGQIRVTRDGGEFLVEQILRPLEVFRFSVVYSKVEFMP